MHSWTHVVCVRYVFFFVCERVCVCVEKRAIALFMTLLTQFIFWLASLHALFLYFFRAAAWCCLNRSRLLGAKAYGFMFYLFFLVKTDSLCCKFLWIFAHFGAHILAYGEQFPTLLCCSVVGDVDWISKIRCLKIFFGVVHSFNSWF